MPPNTSPNIESHMRTWHHCATAWQQEGLFLPVEMSPEALQVLCLHMATLVRLNTARIEGRRGIPTQHVPSSPELPATRLLTFLFTRGLIQFRESEKQSWVSLTDSGTALAKRLCLPYTKTRH